jgi:hypothetical protein
VCKNKEAGYGGTLVLRGNLDSATRQNQWLNKDTLAPSGPGPGRNMERKKERNMGLK